MSMKSVVFGITLATSLLPGTGWSAADSPNIVLIITDDLGYGDLGCYGATKIRTPQVDRLAAQGLRFTRAYAPASTCTPTRYSVLTGEYPWRQKARTTTILDGDAPLAIEPGRVTLPEMLRQAGYTTGVVGKWHLGLGDGVTPVDFNAEIKPGPLEIGFDYCHIIPATVDRVPSVWIENHRVPGLDPADPIQVSYLKNISDEPTGIGRPDLLKQAADKQHSNTIINGISRIGFMKGGRSARFKDEELASTVVAKSVAFLEKHRNERFFLCVGMFEPHVPRVAEPPFAGKSACGIRGDVIEQIDWQTGQIMAALDRLKLGADTLVLFTSDNGPLFFDGYIDRAEEDAGGHQPAGILRGGKYNVFEGGTRVPFIANWPGRVPAAVSDQILGLTDLLATCAALAGRELPERAGMDSLDQSPVLLGKGGGMIRDSVIQQGISGALAIRHGDWKLIPANAAAAAGGMGSGANPDDPRFAAAIVRETQLFNLASDPSEKTNLAARHPEKVAELTSLLRRAGALPAAP
jgi:arylsulfatase A-like enzyme